MRLKGGNQIPHLHVPQRQHLVGLRRIPPAIRLKMHPERSNLKLKYQKVRKKLFNHGQKEAVTTEMIDLRPVVLKKLQSAGLFGDFCNLLRLISKDQFPLHNFSFLLLLDVVKRYSVPNTSNMFYSEECLKFWKVVYRLFHSKVLRFMSGQKSGGQILDASTSRGNFDPKTLNKFRCIQRGKKRYTSKICDELLKRKQNR